jgi:hypothetical protein
MVVSNDTALSIYNSFKRYLTARQIRLLLDDLAQIPGNQSFRDTITRLMHIHSIKAAVGKEDVAISKEEKRGRTGA